jgi:UDP-2,3-diacylglucosamine pyrophosphatase LpxH
MSGIYYFISDVHLGSGTKEDDKKKEEILIRFLEEIKANAKEI